MSGNTLIIRMEVRDKDTWATEKSVSMALDASDLEAAHDPRALVNYHTGAMYEALKRFGA